MIDALLDPVDGVFKEPNPTLNLGNLVPDRLVRRALFKLLVADVQLLLLLSQGPLQGSKEFRVLT